MTKSALRKLYTNKRKELSPERIEDFSLAIANNALKLPIWGKSTYSLFLSMTRHREINTEYLLHILQGKDKNIVLPKTNFDAITIRHFLLTDTTKIALSPYGIPEPVDGFEVSPSQIEAVFVPLLAFDTLGNRIGYGKGFYDRFLSACRDDVLKIGLSFFEAEEDPLPGDSHDIPLTYCVTPLRVYEF